MAEVVKEAANRKTTTKKNATIRADLDRISAHSRPWWGEAPHILARCISLAFAPIRYAAYIAETLISMIFLAIFAFIGLWWFGFVEDSVIIEFVTRLGERALAIIQESGII